MLRFPTSAHAISIFALLISLGGAGYSATGGNFILGKSNGANTQTRLAAPLAGPAFRVDNTSAASGATGMTIITNAARPPLTVNSSVKVANLNADKLDGIDSAGLAHRIVVPFTLNAGAISNPIVIPVGVAVHVAGIVETGSYSGAITVFRTSNGLSWTGTEYVIGQNVVGGASSAVGTSMVNIGYPVSIKTAGPTSILIHNEGDSQRKGYVSLIW